MTSIANDFSNSSDGRINLSKVDCLQMMSHRKDFYWTSFAVMSKSQRFVSTLEISYLHDEAVDSRHGINHPVELLNGANFCLENDFCKAGRDKKSRNVLLFVEKTMFDWGVVHKLSHKEHS